MKSLKVVAVVVLMGAGSAQAAVMDYLALSGKVEEKNTLFSTSPLFTNASMALGLVAGGKLAYDELAKRGYISWAKQEATEGANDFGKWLTQITDNKVTDKQADQVEDALKALRAKRKAKA